jgi:hypothetical protein
MSLTTLILDFMVVSLSLMLLGWVFDLVRSHPSMPDAPSRPDLPSLPNGGSWSRWTEN